MFQISQSLELLAEKNRIQALNQGSLTVETSCSGQEDSRR